MKYTLYKEKSPKTGKQYPKWKIMYREAGKVIKRETGYTDKALTRQKAERTCEELEFKKANPSKNYPDLITEYIISKSPKGGWKGTPWSDDQIKRTRVELEWWGQALKINQLSEVKLSEVEKAVENYPTPLAGKTKNWKVSKLRALITWARKRKYLSINPLDGWENYREINTDPKRALTRQEFTRLWKVLDIDKRMAYMAVMLTGMRRKEIVSLKVKNVDFTRGGINLDWQSEKNSKGSFFHLPESYLNGLHAYVSGRNPGDKLFSVSIHHASENLRRDLKRANVEYKNEKGKIVFHSLRKTFLTMLSQIGNDAKTVQRLGRHSDPNITFGIYVDADENKERETIEGLYKSFDPILIGAGEGQSLSLYNSGVLKVPPRRIESQTPPKVKQSQTQSDPDIEAAKRKIRKFLGIGKTQSNKVNQRHTLRSDIDLSLLTYAQELIQTATGEQLQVIIDILSPRRKRA